MRQAIPLAALLLLALTCPPAAIAEPTPVAVYVLSRDAKFIGSGVGGVRITLQDALSGEVLAQGITEGGTGNTELIMAPRKRDSVIVDGDAASFSAVLDLRAPTKIRVTAYGPLDYPSSANEVSILRWVLPGESERQWILEMPGLVVDVHDTPTLVRMDGAEAAVDVRATVRMMCGCPLTPGGLWDSNEFDIRAQVLEGERIITSAPFAYGGAASEFTASLRVARPGSYRLRVVAHQPRTDNAGVFEQSLVID